MSVILGQPSSLLNGIKPPELASDRVHVWHLNLAGDDETYRKCWDILTNEERERARQFRIDKLQHRFILCRGQLKLLLSAYLSIHPRRIEFVIGKQGKPRLAGTSIDQGLAFNLSHSGTIGLLALAYDRALGVDVEVWREIRNIEGLVARCFAPGEKAYWHSLGNCERKKGFYRIWTCKESFVKAVGKGISLGLNQCAVEIAEKVKFAGIPKKYGLPRQWQLQEIEMSSGISAALTINNPPCKVIHCQLRE